MVTIDQIRQDFPALQQGINGKPLIYFDNAATTHKPWPVLHAMQNVYTQSYSNVHRGVHTLSQQATDQFEAARDKVRQFINARIREEIIFVRGTTEAINLIAQSFARPRLQIDDEILITALEHHANIVPWQLVCEQTGAKLKVAPINDAGEIIFEQFAQLINRRTKLISVSHISNAIGTVNPVNEMIALAKAENIPIVIDGAQAIAHQTIDVQKLDCDFYVFSGHKMYGPTGIGVLYGKSEHLTAMPPYQGGGGMINEVTFEKTRFNSLPYKFEAGTPAIVEAIGLGAAIDYIQALGFNFITQREQLLLKKMTEAAQTVEGLKIIGTAKHKACVLSFLFDDIHPHDIGTILDQEGIAIRSGHHCAMPLMKRLQVPATARASLAFYNTEAEIASWLAALHQVVAIFK